MTTTGETPAEIIARIKAENKVCGMCKKKLPPKKSGSPPRAYCSKECLGKVKLRLK